MKGKKDEKVIQLFGRQLLGTPVTDKQIEHEGEYLGVLPKNLSDRFRVEGLALQARQEEIEDILGAWLDDYSAHIDRVNGAIKGLRFVDEFRPLEQRLFIDQDGHVFIVDNEDDGDD